jgi:hypothetical protein
VIAAGVIRFCYLPTFWLDEAFVAVSLRNPTLDGIFGPLRHGQYFPRVYLASIAALRELLGYRIWVLRLLPSLSFVLATILWARLLVKRAGSQIAPAALGATLLLGSTFWLDQAIQLKQYSLDVLLALVPFSLGDDFFEASLSKGRHRLRVLLLAIPCLISYTYPISLGARLIGWYAHRGRRGRLQLDVVVVCAFVALLGLCLGAIWLTDYRFNRINEEGLTDYWRSSILSFRFQEGFSSGLGLIANFLWGWHHGRLMPWVIAAVAPLQFLGLYRLTTRIRNRVNDDWGSRTLGSLVLLCGVIAASLLVNYPIGAGRLVLFAQVHLQLLAVEGAILICGARVSRKPLVMFLYIAIAVVTVYSVHRYVSFIRTEPIENLRPILPLIKPEIANTVWVNPCSLEQVQSLPQSLPVDRVLRRAEDQLPQAGDRVWILWTNLSEDRCREWLDETRQHAVSWQVIQEGPGSGLALAQF